MASKLEEHFWARPTSSKVGTELNIEDKIKFGVHIKQNIEDIIKFEVHIKQNIEDKIKLNSISSKISKTK